MPLGDWKRHVDDTRSSGDDGGERERVIILRKVRLPRLGSYNHKKDLSSPES